MDRSKLYVSWILWMTCLVVFGQDNRYMVFFSDKDHVPYTIDQPEDFLSERAIDRRAKSGIGITVQDLPVDPDYVSGVKELGAEVYFTSKWFNAALVQMPETLAGDVLALSFVDSIDYIAPGSRLSFNQVAYTVPEDFEAPTAVEASSDLQLAMLRVDEMHEDGYTGEDLMIAVFDDGFMGVNQYQPFEHLFDDSRIAGVKDFVKNSGNPFQYDDHGTRVLSCIAADHAELKGTAYGADYLLCVTEDVGSEYRIEEYNWLMAAEYADSAGADVINSSLGYFLYFSDRTMDYPPSGLDGETTVVARATNIAASKGMVVVVSAGNSGGEAWKYVTSPADSEHVLAVGNVTSTYKKAGSSSVGPTVDGRIKPDVSALGSGTAVFNGKTGKIEPGWGTSFASPQIAGLAAGIWQANPDWTHLQVMNAIRQSGHKAASPDTLVGYGVPNYVLAVQNETLSVNDILEDKIKVYPNPFANNQVTLDLNGLRLDHDFEVSVTDLRGTQFFYARLDPQRLPDKLNITLDNAEAATYFLTIDTPRFRKTIKLIKI